MEAADRLQAARQALQVGEGKTGLRSYQTRTLAPERPAGGVYRVEPNLPRLVLAIRSALTEDSWLALVGVANLGWEALAQAGIDLDRTVLVTCEPAQAAQVLSTLLEGFSLVVVGDVTVSLSQQQVLAARARKLERILFTTSHWPAASTPWQRRSGANSWRRTGKVG